MFHAKDYVLEVVKEQSFSKAAQNLYISQPSLSAAIKKTEQKVGMPLFDRSTTPISLTECGQKYVKTALQIQEQEDDFVKYINDIKELSSGSISIGATTFLASVLLPGLIRRFSEKYPKVQITLEEGNTHDLEQMLFHGLLDLVIETNEFDPEIYERYKVSHEHLVLAVPESYESCHKARAYQLSVEDIRNRVHVKPHIPAVPLHYFSEDDFILLKEDNDTRIRADKIMKNESFDPHVILTLDQQMTAFNLVSRGIGIAFISDTLVRHMPDAYPIRYFKLDNQNNHRDICFYHKRYKYVTPAMEEFLKLANPKP